MECNNIWGSTKFSFKAFLVQRYMFETFHFLKYLDIANYDGDSTTYNWDRKY